MILSGVMMLEHVGETGMADRIKKAIGAVIREGKVRTYDMMRLPGGPDVFKAGAVTTQQLTDAIIEKL